MPNMTESWELLKQLWTRADELREQRKVINREMASLHRRIDSIILTGEDPGDQDAADPDQTELSGMGPGADADAN